MIQTVLGEIDENQFGIASSHEHIFINMKNCVDICGKEDSNFFKPLLANDRYKVFTNPYAVLDNALINNYNIQLKELKLFKRNGGNTIVDCTLDEIGRNAQKLKKISIETGINIIMGCGCYYKKAHLPYVKDATCSDIVKIIRHDLTDGVKNTKIKSGFIGEIGTSAVLDPNEIKVCIAAGIVSGETNKAIHVHTDLYSENGLNIVKILEKEGAKQNKICIDHIDVKICPNYIYSLLDMGVYIEFDNFGKEFFVSKEKRFAYDIDRVKLISEIIQKGYVNQLLISNDICLKSMLTEYGGNGYAHILTSVKQMLLEYGVSEKKYNQIISKNVWNFLN